MKSIEFGKICQPLNLEYRKLFGYVPCKDDYVCTQEDYIEALKNAIKDKKELSDYIKKRERKPYLDKNIRY